MWQKILTASSENEAYSATPTIADIPAGSQVKIRIDLQLWAPVGKLADIAGAELWAQKLYPEMTVTDVYGDWHWIEIRGVAKGFGPVVVALIVFGVLALFGVSAWAAVSISADIKERELAKMEFIREMAPIYGADTVTRWLEGIESPPPGIDLPSWVPAAGLGIGTLLLIGLGVFLISRK